MPPPSLPVTPSPHRFVVKKERNVRRTPLAPPESRPQPPSSQTQFKATPRFTFSSTPRPTPTREPPRVTPFATRFSTPAPKSAHRDAIDDFPDETLQESIEIENEDVDFGYEVADGSDDYRIEEPSPKRRRISSSPEPDLLGGAKDEEEVKPSIQEPDEDLLSFSLPILSSPPTARQRLTTTAPRFLTSTPATILPQASSPQSTFLKPPRFRPPDPSETQKQSDPLPDQFSPHRKGQKYVPGGLAAEVRDWLVDIESTIPFVPRAGKEDIWLVKILVDEISGSGRAGMTLVRGRQVHVMGTGSMADTLGVVKVILAGEGAGTGLQKGSAVGVGKTVGIKGPLWEIVIEGEKWGVGVDWKVLSG